ncbi:hypothetical protein GCM10020219_055900 [Nonomuraea dietziae]
MDGGASRTVTGPAHYKAARDREEGLRLALAEAGVAQTGQTLCGPWSQRWGAACRRDAADGRA